VFGAARASKTAVGPIPASARISAPPRGRPGPGDGRRVLCGGLVSDGIEVGADAYEAWASGYDLRTGQPKGTLKENGVRFYVKVTNVPKDRSIAAEAWDDVSAALDAAMDRAGAEMGR